MGLIGEKGNKRLSFTAEGITCGHCRQSVEEGLRSLSGVKSSKVNLKKNRAQIVYHPETFALEDVKRKVEELGYKADIN